MSKVKINVDIVKSIIVGILKEANESIGAEGKTLLSCCGLGHVNAFYTRKHRLTPAKSYLESLNDGIHKGYCLVELAENSRVFNANLDFSAITASLTFWVQTSALPFLDELIDNANLDVNGERYQIPELIDRNGHKVSRSATASLSSVIIDEIKSASEIGESAICRVTVAMNLTQNLAIMGDSEIDISLRVSSAAETPTLFKNITVNKFDWGSYLHSSAKWF